ncbi:hypothetical protein DL89DRAFT_135931 [Linderina pennispora]|uniref:Uncharacterized protein n=1 Tax=Linderina pennispora TaxID=61395 RepID=A0A1Y1WAZ9_9FUNG|nr:uncharacterized protein DL89DRAFT_135931 [Linderina pennispora]ORX70545.1 hypothetical protein DL89DRAFT_135931 [Linderina pennispora]
MQPKLLPRSSARESQATHCRRTRGHPTPTPSLYDVDIHGTAADWENYALTMNLNSSSEHGHLSAIPEHLSPPPPVPPRSSTSPRMPILDETPLPLLPNDTAPHPPTYSQSCTVKPQVYVTSDRPSEPSAPTIGEFLRFDDMDIPHNRVQYFSTGEGGRKCMEEISRDGYMLFYALQRVELPSDKAHQESLEGRTWVAAGHGRAVECTTAGRAGHELETDY